VAKPPLEVFDARIVQSPLQGLLRNMDEELSRRLRASMASRDREPERRLSLLLMMLRFTKNSYDAVCFLLSSTDETPKRKKEFVLVLPPTNRQLLDLLFTLVFMMDDFETRSTEYELCSYRQAREEYDKFYSRYGKHPQWQSRFQELQEWLRTLEKYFAITPQRKADLKQIPYWFAPYRLMKAPTKSQPFMKFLEKWIYGETSAQAHLNPAGLLSMGEFLVSDFGPENVASIIKERDLERFTFRHFTRMLTTVVAILTEIDNFCHLGNRESLTLVWVSLAGYVTEADDVYKERYQAMLA
jgi:hypothetical protein